MKVFLDTSVLVAALLSPEGGSAQIVEFCEAKLFQGVISSDVDRELMEVIRRKFPEVELHAKKILKAAHLKIIKKTAPTFLKKASRWIEYLNDAKILAAAKQGKTDYLITLDIRHFLKDPKIAQKAGMKISTPGDFLKIFRSGLN